MVRHHFILVRVILACAFVWFFYRQKEDRFDQFDHDSHSPAGGMTSSHPLFDYGYYDRSTSSNSFILQVMATRPSSSHARSDANTKHDHVHDHAEPDSANTESVLSTNEATEATQTNTNDHTIATTSTSSQPLDQLLQSKSHQLTPTPTSRTNAPTTPNPDATLTKIHPIVITNSPTSLSIVDVWHKFGNEFRGSKNESRNSSLDTSHIDSAPTSVPFHLQSTLLNDTCTLSSPPNGTSLVMTCPGCTIEIPLHHANFDLEMFFQKAVNYAYASSLVTLVQLYFTFRQMKMSEAPAASTRLCRYTIGMQALLDGYQSIFHLFIAFNCEALFNAFLVTFLIQFVACATFGMAFLQHLYRVAYPIEFESGLQRAQIARQRIHCKFYTWLTLGMLIFWAVPYGFTIVYTILYGFWIPQIFWQAEYGFRHGFRLRYIVAMSITRVILPLYFLACPVNFLNHQPDLWMSWLLILWMAAQVAVLLAQRKWGARFFVPARFLPHQYDYHRSIPLLSLNRRPRPVDPPAPDAAADLSGLSAALAPEASSSNSSTTNGRRADHVSISVNPSPSSSTSSSPAPLSNVAAAMAAPDDDNPCPICYNELDPDQPLSIMVCPCDHLFHTTCLKKWMKQKSECPVCRSVLPTVEEQQSGSDSEPEPEPEPHPPDQPEPGHDEPQGGHQPPGEQLI